MNSEPTAKDDGTVEWHEHEAPYPSPDSDVTVIIGQTRDGRMWIAPLGTPPSTSYPPDDHWVYLGQASSAR